MGGDPAPERRVCFSVGEVLGLALDHHRAGKLDVAEALYTRILETEPDNADCLHYLGVIAIQVEKWDLAHDLIGRALARRPDDAAFLSHSAAALNGLKRFEEAEAAARRAVMLAPDLGTAYINLGNALRNQVRLREAAETYGVALRHEPDHGECRANYALMLRWLGETDAWWHQIATAAAAPDADPDTVLLAAEAALERGDFASGLDLYERRYDLKGTRALKRSFARPQWAGEDLAGLTIFIYDEQGFGDVFQFIRYLPLVKRRGARVILQVHPAVRSLIARVPGWDVLLVHGEEPAEGFDFHCPLLSLPRAFRTALDTIPADVPYLTSNAGRRKRWRKRLVHAAGTDLKVGLVWKGRSAFHGDRWRSPGLEPLLPLLDIPGIRWFGLQMGDGRADLDGRTLPPSFVDLGGAIADFEDTAAIMDELDLVVSSCTSPAHLAGALGKPVWVLLNLAPDWRWLRERQDSPWYPTARLFRQTSLDDWSDPVGRAAAALAELAGHSGA